MPLSIHQRLYQLVTALSGCPAGDSSIFSATFHVRQNIRRPHVIFTLLFHVISVIQQNDSEVDCH
jgi:hypothetical protein